MILYSSASSPFVRKVRIAASLLGLSDKIDVRNVDLNDPADPLRLQNPLGKIPALILEDGTTCYDSRVILEVLDHVAGGGKIIPAEPKARFAVLGLQALCDGMLDASILIVYESRYRPPEKLVQAWIDRQTDKIERALTALEAKPPGLDEPSKILPDVGQISLACALGYQDLRFGGTWRKNIRNWWPGSIVLTRRCRLSRRPRARLRPRRSNLCANGKAPDFRSGAFRDFQIARD